MVIHCSVKLSQTSSNNAYQVGSQYLADFCPTRVISSGMKQQAHTQEAMKVPQ